MEKLVLAKFQDLQMRIPSKGKLSTLSKIFRFSHLWIREMWFESR